MTRMDLPVLEKFCFDYDLWTGCFCMGVVNCGLTLFQIFVLSEFAMELKGVIRGAVTPLEVDSTNSVVFTIVILMDVLTTVKFLGDGVFVIAAYKENRRLMKKYCIFWIIFTVLFIIGALKCIFQMDLLYIVAHVFYIAENFYFIVVIRSYLLSINEDGVL